MADIKISQLPAAAAALGTQEFEVNESGTSKKITGTQIEAFVKASLVVTDITDLTASATELNYVDGVTSGIQTQLNAKVAQTSGTGSAVLPSGTDAQRDGSPLAGYIRFNTDANTFEGYDGTQWGAIAGGGGETSFLQYEYTATLGQTTFSGADDNSATLSYTVSNLIVTLNGVVLDNGGDYTATNGTSVVLTSGAAAGDLLQVIAFKSFTVADMVPASTGGTFAGNVAVNGNLTVDTNTLFVDAANNRVGIGTSSPSDQLTVLAAAGGIGYALVGRAADGYGRLQSYDRSGTVGTGSLAFFEDGTISLNRSNTGSLVENARIDASGRVLIGTTSNTPVTSNVYGVTIGDASNGTPLAGVIQASANGNTSLFLNRGSDDGNLVGFYQAGSLEGTISVSGTTVSYNGGHLSRWSQTADNTRIELLKGTVLTNLDQMAVWGDEDNEQLNCMAVSSVEGDPNVAGVFVNWDNDDNEYTADMNVAMTGDMIIRIAQGTTVQRGDLLMSAGDGTAKPQGDDIVRSKTIAKVTSTHVTCTYEDGSYCVPCVLMAC